MRRIPLGPLLSLIVLLAVTLMGGAVNGAEASGTVVDDWAGTPIAGAQVSFGERKTVTDGQGRWSLGPVPKGAKLSALKAGGYGRADFTVDTHEVRLQPATLTLLVTDSKSNQPVTTAKAAKDGQEIGNANGADNLVVAPHPGRDVPFVVCAKDYAQKQVSSNTTTLSVTLDPQPGGDCPAPPPPSPSPSASPTP